MSHALLLGLEILACWVVAGLMGSLVLFHFLGCRFEVATARHAAREGRRAVLRNGFMMPGPMVH